MVVRRGIGRRRVLAMAGGVVGVTALGVSVATGALDAPDVKFVETTCERGKESGMGKRVLVAYASRAGSTGEVSEAIGQVLCEAGASVDVRRVQDVADLGPYGAVVIGSAARMGKLLPEAIDFARKHRADLQRVPVAYFMTGTTMVEDTPERRKQAAAYLEPLNEVSAPAAESGLFAGKVDHTKLSFPWRFLLSFVKEGEMADGDHRDWEAIRGWARQVAPAIVG